MSKYFRTEKSDCDDKLAGAPSDVWLKLGVGGCTRPRQFVDLIAEGNTVECSLTSLKVRGYVGERGRGVAKGNICILRADRGEGWDVRENIRDVGISMTVK